MVQLHNITNEKVLNFDWDTFSAKLKKLIEYSSKISVVAINADRWEELLYAVLCNMNETFEGGKPRWILGSHKPGTDIWIDKFAISAKSGNLQNNNLIISSYRLTRFNDIEEMKDFIDSPEGKNYDIYLCCARTDNRNGSRTYTVFLVDADVFHANELNWEDMHLRNGGSHSGWRGTNNEGVKVEIRRKMSNQLWLSLPLNLCNKLVEITISKENLGSEAGNILENER
tara:strand:- start:1246 stop:1929 length:684 start_codon:yes stop_codon:yes gene_type:complete